MKMVKQIRAGTLTLILVNLAGIMERADESILPGVYKEVGAALHTDPTGVGSLTLFRSIVQASCYPLATYLAVRHDRTHVIAFGAILWAAATFLVGLSTTFAQIAVSSGLNGIGLAIIIPAIQSLVADSTDETNRGTAFGWLSLTSSFGSIIGGFLSILLASTSFMGIPAMWLELIGFSHKQTAFLCTLFAVATSIGALIGGKMGDVLAQKLPNAGRIMLSQISSGSAIPLAAILLLALPDDPSTAVSHGLVLLIMGLLHWNASATNNPIFAEIVPERARTSIYALDRSFESILASFATPSVGILAQHIYGYKPIPKGSTNSEAIAIDRENAASLAKALYTAIGIPMTIACFIYSFLYCSYPRDRDRARMQALIESEMQQMETDRLPLQEESTQLHLLESDEFQAKGRSIIDMEYEGKESLEYDENDEKKLLLHPKYSEISKS